MPETYDVIVVGCGVMGAAVSRHLASRGASVLGLDRHAPPHAWGSSHGRTRLIREAYYEHPLYVPLVRRSYELWRELELETGEALLTTTGSIMFGHPDSEIVHGTLRSAREHSVPHEVLDTSATARRFPAFAPPEEMVGIYEPGSSLLKAEHCVAGLLDSASRLGAKFEGSSRVKGWKCCSTGVEVIVNGWTRRGRALVIAAGAWARSLAPEALAMLQVERQVQHWWTPARHPERFGHDQMPVSMWQLPDRKIFYTMPDFGDGLKLGWHHNGQVVDPDTASREPTSRDKADMGALLGKFLPDGRGAQREAAVCFYTNTPDGHFIVDRHPEFDRVWIVSACSGHGFKFAPAVGEILADLITQCPPAFDLTPFRLSRFSPP